MFTRTNYRNISRWNQRSTTHLFEDARPYVAVCGFLDPFAGWHRKRPASDHREMKLITCGSCLRTEAGRAYQYRRLNPGEGPWEEAI